MIKRQLLRKKQAIAAMTGILMLLLAASCLAQTPLEKDGAGNSDTCTNCNDDSSGLLITNDTDLSEFSIGPDLGAPELVSPWGIQNSGKLTYTWKGVSGSQTYCLVVKDSQDRVVIKECCSALSAKKKYSITPRKILPSGEYTWRISYRVRGHTLWSDQMEFTVCTSLPGRATLISPKDDIGSKNPTFRWYHINGATQYRLKVAKAASPDTPIFENTYDTEDVYSDIDQTCSVGPVLPQDLEEAVYYRWWIQTINCMGERPWSFFKDFRYMPVTPGKPTPISPSGLISTNTPAYFWTKASAATDYHLEVYIRNKSPADDFILVDEGWFDANKVTKGSRCSGSLGTLPDEDSVFFWRVQASNDAADGPWSVWKYFETVCAFKPGKDAKKSTDGRSSRKDAKKRG
ncbi:MAG: hypothetical protein A4E49_03479 [Methanosaeta sp. PtaU1.Bin112]|nr:MAG: hypothetical protein A4E49_03479 [Methanosaeta sp. PtaU1.Bin112]